MSSGRGRSGTYTAGPECNRVDDDSLMTNHISIQVEDDEQYERLQQVRTKYGLTWKGLLIQGARRVEEDDPAVGDDDEP